MNLRKVAVGFALISAVLSLSGCNRGKKPSDVNDMPSAPTQLSLTGTVEAPIKGSIVAPAAGILTKVLGKEQMRVTPGQIVAQISNKSLLLQLEAAEKRLQALYRQRQRMIDNYNRQRSGQAVRHVRQADIIAALADLRFATVQLNAARQALKDRSDLQAAVQSAQNGVQNAQQTFDASAAAVKAAEQQLPIEQDRYNSVKKLYDNQAVTREELRAAEERLQTAINAVNNARAAYNRDLIALESAKNNMDDAQKKFREAKELKSAFYSAQARYQQSAASYRKALEPPDAAPVNPPDVDSLDTQIVDAQADIVSIQQQVADLNIVAPMSGVLTDWAGEEGEYLQAGQSLGTVVNLEKLKVTTDVRPSIGLFLSPGKTVQIVIEGPPRQEFKGQVESINPILDEQKGTQKITIAFNNPKKQVLPGTEVSIEIDTGKKGKK
jgi:multidrug resistance efflux pump